MSKYLVKDLIADFSHYQPSTDRTWYFTVIDESLSLFWLSHWTICDYASKLYSANDVLLWQHPEGISSIRWQHHGDEPTAEYIKSMIVTVLLERQLFSHNKELQ